jgi:hypothetical protein
MITIPAGFDFNLLISDLCVVGIPFVSVAVCFFVFRVIQSAINGGID